MPELKTDDALLKAIQEAAKSKPTADEVHAQRISFILSSLDKDSGVTRDKVEEVLKDQLGEKAA